MKLFIYVVLFINVSAHANSFCLRQEQKLNRLESEIIADADGVFSRNPSLRQWFLEGLSTDRANFKAICGEGRKEVASFCKRQKKALEEQALSLERSSSEDFGITEELYDWFILGIKKDRRNAEKICGPLDRF